MDKLNLITRVCVLVLDTDTGTRLLFRGVSAREKISKPLDWRTPEFNRSRIWSLLLNWKVAYIRRQG